MDKCGQVLEEARRSVRLTQCQLATKAGISQAGLSQFESGDLTPSIKTLGKLVAAIFEERIGEGAKVLGLGLVGHAEDGRAFFEIIAQVSGKEIVIPLEGKRPLGERKSHNALWPSRTKQHLEMLADLLDVSLDGPPLVVRQIARSIGGGGR